MTHEDVDREHLGGASIHTQVSGVAHLAAPDEAPPSTLARRILGYLPQNNLSDPPSVASTDPVDRRDAALDSVVPDDPSQPYDMHDVIDRVVESAIRSWSCSRHGRRTSSRASRGSMAAASGSSPSSRRCSRAPWTSTRRTRRARFVRMCDAFNVPLLTLEDVPGFLPGVTQEHGGIIRHGAKLLYAYCEATVPKVTVITRKAYGGAYDVMSSKHVGGDINLAWPTARIAVMGAEGAVNIIFRDELAAGRGPGSRAVRELTARVRGHVRQPVGGGGSRVRRRRHRCRPRPARGSSPPSGCWRASATATRPGSTATSRCDPPDR